MLTTDDERTLQVLEAVVERRLYKHGNSVSIPMDVLKFTRWLPLTDESGEVFLGATLRITDAGRAKLDELREKKGKC